MKYLSLFSGIGGAEKAILSVFPEAECLGYCETDPLALKVYQKHFPNHKSLGDVSCLSAARFRGKVDLIIGGPPCQPFSVAGKKKGFSDPRGQLMEHFMRIFCETEARFFILENVAYMSRANLAVFDKMTKVSSVVLNARDFLPQWRQRRFWCNFPVDKKNSSDLKIPLEDILIHDEVSSSISTSKWKDLPPAPDNDAPTAFFQKAYGSPMLPRPDGLMNTVTCTRSQKGYIYDGRKFRALQAEEVERLQGFPDGYTSDLTFKKRQKVLGNAFCVPMVIHVVLCLTKIMTVL